MLSLLICVTLNHLCVNVWGSEDDLWEVVLFLYHVGSRGRSQVVRLGSGYPLSYLIGPPNYLLNIFFLLYSVPAQNNCGGELGAGKWIKYSSFLCVCGNTRARTQGLTHAKQKFYH